MQVWWCGGCVGCVGVLFEFPARTPPDQSVAVRPPPSVGYLLTSLHPGALSVVLRRRQVNELDKVQNSMII